MQAHAVPDNGGFADHHPGAVVDEETLADDGGRMYVDTGLRSGDLGDEAGRKASAEPMQRMSQTVVDQRRHAGIAEQDFGRAGRRRVPVEGGTKVADQPSTDQRKRRREGARDGQGFAIDGVRQ